MSECVVRMEMPKSCWVCPFGIDGYIWDKNDAKTHHVRLCSQHSGVEYHVLKINDSDRPWYCDSFICQLPEGHGRLVDADEAMEKLIHYGFRAIDMTVHECIEDEITTIVPSER